MRLAAAAAAMVAGYETSDVAGLGGETGCVLDGVTLVPVVVRLSRGTNGRLGWLSMI